MRVLIVDDEAFIGDLFRDICEMGEASCDVARSCKEARELLAGGGYDMIFVDYSLKEEDGIAFIKEVRSAGNAPEAYLMSGWPESHFDSRDLTLFTKVLHKPFNVSDILDILKNHG
jgi:DNA-binding response OmpR family regulator